MASCVVNPGTGLPWKTQGCQNLRQPITVSGLTIVHKLLKPGRPHALLFHQKCLQYPIRANIRRRPSAHIPGSVLSLRVSVISWDRKNYITHHARCIGPSLFRKTELLHWIWIRRRERIPKQPPGRLNGKIPQRVRKEW